MASSRLSLQEMFILNAVRAKTEARVALSSPWIFQKVLISSKSSIINVSTARLITMAISGHGERATSSIMKTNVMLFTLVDGAQTNQ